MCVCVTVSVIKTVFLGSIYYLEAIKGQFTLIQVHLKTILTCPRTLKGVLVTLIIASVHTDCKESTY